MSGSTGYVWGHPLLGLRHDRNPCWKPLELKEMEQHFINVVKLRNDRLSRSYSPEPEMVFTLFVPKPVIATWAPPLYPRSLHKLWDMISVRRCANGIQIISMICSKVEGSHLMPEPLITSPSGFEPDGRLHWKPPEWENEEWGSDNVVRPKQIGMSKLYSPRLKMAFTPLAFEPMDDLPDFSSPLTHYFSLPHEPWDMVAGKRCSCNIVIIMNNEMSKEHSPDAKNVLKLSD